MSLTGDQPGKSRKEFAFNLALSIVVGQVGCLTLVIILAALFGGLWLDNHFASRPLLTIILVISSIPISVLGMYGIVKGVISRIKN